MVKKSDDIEPVQEIDKSKWLDKPVIAAFGEEKYMVGMNGIAALNYEELMAEARALVEPVRDALMMQDLGFEEDPDGEIFVTISLDGDEEEEEAGDESEEAVSGHHFFTCPQELAERAVFLRVGMRVQGYTAGQPVTGEIIDGNWSYVTVRDEAMRVRPFVSVNTLQVLSQGSVL